MCRPTHYTIAYEINPWMRLKQQALRPLAIRQWEALHALLTTQLNIRVRLLTPVRALPDLVFTANAGLVRARTLVRSNFRHAERQGEEPVVERAFRRWGYRIVRLPARYRFEGEGDALWLGERLVLGFRFRSDAPAHEPLSRAIGCEVLPVELADRRFYHLDTCFCPLTADAVLWYPKAFDRYGRRVIERHAEGLAVSEADALTFCCNAIVTPARQDDRGVGGGRAVVLHRGISAALRRKLTARGFDVYEVDLSEFLKAGGSAKCLVLKLSTFQVA